MTNEEAKKTVPPEVLRQQQVMQMALRGPVARFYANGVNVAMTASDLSIILLTNGTPTGVLSVSYITAKSIVDELSEAIGKFETATKYKIKGIQEIDADLQKTMEGMTSVAKL